MKNKLVGLTTNFLSGLVIGFLFLFTLILASLVLNSSPGSSLHDLTIGPIIVFYQKIESNNSLSLTFNQDLLIIIPIIALINVGASKLWSKKIQE